MTENLLPIYRDPVVLEETIKKVKKEELKDITFEEKTELCPQCKIPLTFKGWLTTNSNPLGEIIFLLFAPKSWIKGYYYQCDKCKHIYEKNTR